MQIQKQREKELADEKLAAIKKEEELVKQEEKYRSELEHTLTKGEEEVVEGSLNKKKPCGGGEFTKTRKFRRRGLVRN